MPNFIDLFSGAGGLSLGLEMAGFKALAATDFDASAAATYEQAHPGVSCSVSDIAELSAHQLLEAAAVNVGGLDLLVGGPPCQGFSVNNHKRSVDDPRSNLFRHYLRLVADLEPKWIVFENVTGITSAGSGSALRALLSGLNSLGYICDWTIVKAEQYGVPQERRRLIIIGSHSSQRAIAALDFLKSTASSAVVPAGMALGDLPKLRNGEGEPVQNYRSVPRNAYQAFCRQKATKLFNHMAPKLSDINIERMQYVKPGGSWRDIPFDLLPLGMKRAKRSDHTKRYGRIDPSKPSCTILTKCDLHWGAYIHPTQDRILTVREAARLQSFPDHVIFQGSRTEQYVQVGNAVPPLLGKHIGAAILKAVALPDVSDGRYKFAALSVAS